VVPCFGQVTRAETRDGGNVLIVAYDYAYDVAHRLASIEHLAGSSLIARHAYTYDVWGNRSTAADTLAGATVTNTYTYDALDRLKSVAIGTASQDEGYSFDLFGNRLTKSLGTPVTQRWSSTHDAAQQITQVQQTVGGSAVTALLRYDDNGNLKKLCEAGSTGGTVSGTSTDCTASGTGSATTTLGWNGLDQLVTLARAGSAALNEAYAYDDAGRRLQKTGAGGTPYLYDGDAILGEWNGSVSGSPSAVYAQGQRDGGDDPLMRLTGNSGGTDATVRYYAQDGIGSVSAFYGQGQEPTNVVQDAGASLAQTSGGGYTVGGIPSNVNALKDGDRSANGGHWTATSGSTLDITFAASRTNSEVVLIGNPGTTANGFLLSEPAPPPLNQPLRGTQAHAETIQPLRGHEPPRAGTGVERGAVAPRSCTPLITFTGANIGQYATLMQMSGATSMSGYQTAITAEVNAGGTVTVPHAQIAYTDPVDAAKAGRGAIYMSENASSGAYGALIDCALSGGYPLFNSSPVPTLFASTPAAPSFQSQSNGGISLLTTLPPGTQATGSITTYGPIGVGLCSPHQECIVTRGKFHLCSSLGDCSPENCGG
jgi:hypothetical protein